MNKYKEDTSGVDTSETDTSKGNRAKVDTPQGNTSEADTSKGDKFMGDKPNEDKITGRCHCGAVAFTVPARIDFTKATRCDCSLCRRRWAPMASVPIEELDVIKGREMLDCYQWNTKVAEHYYCTTCHVYLFHRRRSDPNEYGVNPGCFDIVDMRSLRDTEIADGINHPSDQ